MIPRLPQAVLAPRRGEKSSALQTLAVSNTGSVRSDPGSVRSGPGSVRSDPGSVRPGPGRPRKKAQPGLVKTVYKKTAGGRIQSEAEAEVLPPVKRMKLSQQEIMKLLGEDERRMLGQNKENVQQESQEKEEENSVQEQEIKAEPEQETKFSLEEENPPSIDNPREFSELLAREAQYIGDMDSLYHVMDNLDDMKNETEKKHLEFMKKLDTWGPREENFQHTFSGFSGYVRELETSGDLDIPEDWEDPDLFADLDSRLVSESVFLNTWLPKFALKIRKDPYRALIRSINKKDPEFNIVW